MMVSAPDIATLELILHTVQQHGATRASGAAQFQPAPADGVLPDGFYATTNLETMYAYGGCVARGEYRDGLRHYS